MAETMRKQGFRIVEHGPQVQLMARQSVPDAPQVTASEAIELGKALRAEAVVLGRAVAGNAPNMMGSDLRSFKGGIMARAYLTASGEEISNVDKTAVTANADVITGSREALQRGRRTGGRRLDRPDGRRVAKERAGGRQGRHSADRKPQPVQFRPISPDA